MMVLCELYRVPQEHYAQEPPAEQPRKGREVDFYLIGGDGRRYRCEVKLMGKGNPESADAAFARGSDVLVADTLSNAMKQNLTKQGILWVEMSNPNSLKRFQSVLEKLKIPFEPVDSSRLSATLDGVIQRLLSGGELVSSNIFTVREDAKGHFAED